MNKNLAIVELDDDGIGISPVVAGTPIFTEIGAVTDRLLSQTIPIDFEGPLRTTDEASPIDPFSYTTSSFFRHEQKLCNLANPLRSAQLLAALDNPGQARIVRPGLKALANRLVAIAQLLEDLFGVAEIVLTGSFSHRLLDVLIGYFTSLSSCTISIAPDHGHLAGAVRAGITSFDVQAFCQAAGES